MNKGFNKNAQGGFTLIELIVVIVILGILAATALPKFANLSGDARIASLKAARGAMASASSMAHGKWLIAGGADLTIEGTKVTITNGYPAAETAFATLAGLSTDDYDINVNGGVLTVSPTGLTTAQKADCQVSYTTALASNTPALASKLTKCE